MATPPPLRPTFARRSSRVPGGFDTDDELSPLKTTFDNNDLNFGDESTTSVSRDTIVDDGNVSQGRTDDAGSPTGPDSSTFDEREMRRNLMDMESSFLPAPSPIGKKEVVGTDDTYVFGSPRHSIDESRNDRRLPQSPKTPPESYQTPAPGRENGLSQHHDFGAEVQSHANTSSLETMSSSPTAAAAARTVSRVVSLASMGGYETAEEESVIKSNIHVDDQSTPKLTVRSTAANSQTPTKLSLNYEAEDLGNHADADRDGLKSLDNPRKRPKYLYSRQASQRSSYSSYTSHTTSTEGASDLTIGAEYALQTGGAVPFGGSNAPLPHVELSRSISLGSMASGISAISGDEDKHKSASHTFENLNSLQEEDGIQTLERDARGRSSASPNPHTPRATSRSVNTPTNTTVSYLSNRGFLDQNRNSSLDRRNGLPTPATSRSKNLTLKEQSSTIDKLQKENWDLKLKIQFMSNALNQRSEEGVAAMISENVELRTYKVNSAREIRNQKRLVRELEHKFKELQERFSSRENEARNSSNPPLAQEDREAVETEVLFLRERVETYESEIEKLRHESGTKDGEKKRLAEIVKSLSERRHGGSDIGVREEVDMWKDLLETETARREQADEDNKRLQEELWRLKADAASTVSYNHLNNTVQVDRRRQVSSSNSQINGSGNWNERDGAISGSSVTLVEQLRHENAELRREVGAQTSMLTSRNREKERLYQEIEDLKMGQRRSDDALSITGDSIFERSASRAHGRSISRASGATRNTQISDAERELYETKNGELRDQISDLKLKNQELATQMEVILDELEQTNALRAEFDKLEQTHIDLTETTNQELLTMQRERDEALELYEETESSFKDLKEEAQERIDALEDELDQKSDLLERLEGDLSNREEESNTLRNEVRMMSEGLNRVEADIQTKLRRVQELELENEDINRELESLEKSLIEANGKGEKLVIEIESRQGECAFLREEQDACMLKIGDLETALRTAQTSLSSEQDRTKDLEDRLADERHQREVIGSKEKQDVQKIINDLNREASSAKDESRMVKKSLENRESEVSNLKERLAELETGLRDALKEPNGTKSSFFTAISRTQQEIMTTTSELVTVRQALSEKERVLQKRDALLESHGLESRKLSELLDKERAGRRADKAQHEQWQKSHQHTSRTVTQKETRIMELESARQTDRKKIATLEQQFKDQLLERNNLLLSLWSRLSSMCGSDWQHQNSLVSGHLPTLEVVSNMLPGFSKNLLLAAKTIEAVINDFKTRIRGIERDFMKDFQALEHNLDMRIKRLDRLESAVQVSRVSSVASAAPEIAKLRGENRLLKNELAMLQKQDMHVRASRPDAKAISGHERGGSGSRNPSAMLIRGYSTTAVETLERGSGGTSAPSIQSQPIEPSQQRWIHRLRELERRLKAEREARLLDRSGARKRLEEGRAENEELRLELEREKERVRAGRQSRAS